MTENFQAFLKLKKTNLFNKYVIIVNKKIVATGIDIESMLKKVRKEYPRQIPFIAKIPDNSLLVL